MSVFIFTATLILVLLWKRNCKHTQHSTEEDEIHSNKVVSVDVCYIHSVYTLVGSGDKQGCLWYCLLEAQLWVVVDRLIRAVESMPKRKTPEENQC